MNEGGAEDPMDIDRWSRALSWHVALRDADEKELTNSVGRAWQDWYADAKNRRVFDNMNRLLADRDLYRKRRPRWRAEREDDSYDLSVPIAEWRQNRTIHETRKRHSTSGNRWRWLSGGIGVAAIAMLIFLWPRPFGFGGDSGGIVYQTKVGGLKDVYLPDGSSIILGGRTVVSVAFSPQHRSVSVIEGQAWFRVAHDPRWPFVVSAGDGTITDIGTGFLVTRESDRVVVTVTEGAVEVSARQPMHLSFEFHKGLILRPILTPIRVSRGEELAFSDSGALSSVKQADTRAATAWTYGRLTFDDQPLRYVVDTLNRYSSRPIVIGPSAGALRFSGIVFDGEIGDWLESLKLIFPVTVEQQGADVRIQMRYPMPVTSQALPKTQP